MDEPRKPGRPLKAQPDVVALLVQDIYKRRSQVAIDVLQDIMIAALLDAYGCPLALGWLASHRHPPCRTNICKRHIFTDFRDVTYLGAHRG
jgi:hypothetical protein